jgi:crotonobetaine/carnitine-CoA ligase
MSASEIENELKKDGEVIVEKLQEWAEIRGDNPFFYYGEEDQSLSYRQFNQLANSIANTFKAMGIEKGDRISLFLKNQLVTTLAMFGIWKAGAVYCPINFNYVGKLLAYQIKDTGPKLLITEQGLLSALNQIKSDFNGLKIILHRPKEKDHDFNPKNAEVKPDNKYKTVSFDDLLTGDRSDPAIPISYSDTLSIIYTSGTTGNPKGVVQSHRWLHNYIFPALKFIGASYVIFNDLPLYHIGGAFQNVAKGAWAGCKVAAWDKFSPGSYWTRIRKSGATAAMLLDVMVPWLMAEKETPQDSDNSLYLVHLQPLPANHNEFAKRFGIRFVSIGYASTEVGAGFAGVIDEMGDAEEVKRLAKAIDLPLISGREGVKKGFIGKPTKLHEVAVLDDNGHELGPGEVGQLAVRSKLPHLMLNEYFNKPEATDKVLKNGWYHTGDIVYKDEDGFFYFVDRMSGFIRVRGENLSSSQVEDLILGHPKVANCAAFPIPAAVGDEEDLVACIVVKPGEDLTEESLRMWMKAEMPKFMWPKHIKFISELPVTPTFKVEKYKLKERILGELGMKPETGTIYK